METKLKLLEIRVPNWDFVSKMKNKDMIKPNIINTNYVSIKIILLIIIIIIKK